jgi:tetratricopeptide (TPR) repeat protein
MEIPSLIFCRRTTGWHALHAYEKCFQIRKAILGETDYYTEVTRRERAICKFSLTKGHEGREDLKRFVDRIEEGFFINDIDHEQLQILEAKTLCTLLMDLSEISNPDEYKKYLKIYGRLCLKYEYTGEPCISMRMAWNMRGGYYMCIGDYIQAESAFLNALKVDVNDEKKSIISRTQIQSNLLLIYYVQNDLEKAYPLAADLLDQIENDESEESIKDADIYRIYTLLVSMEIQTVSAPVQEEFDDIANLLKETCEDILSGDILKAPREEAIFAIICIFFIIQHETSTVSDQKQFSLALHRIELEKRVFDFAPMQLTILYYCQALLLWNIGEKDAGDYFEKAINCLDKSGIQHNLNMSK